MPLFRRSDGDVVKDLPAYRRIMPLIMPTRTQCAVYFEQRIEADNALDFIDRWNDAHPDRKASFFNLLVHEVTRVLDERPRMNRFVSGGRLYQRRGVWIGYSAKKAMTDDAPLVALKKEFDPRASFAEHVAVLNDHVKEGKSDKKSSVDKELGLVFLLPLFIVKFLVWLLSVVDGWNLLPASFIRSDPLYASVFLANLGSIKLDAAYHHNYEYGNISIFGTVGKIHRVLVGRPDGSIANIREIILRWTFDERIEDGLYAAKSLELLKQRLEAPRDLTGARIESFESEPTLGRAGVRP